MKKNPFIGKSPEELKAIIVAAEARKAELIRQRDSQQEKKIETTQKTTQDEVVETIQIQEVAEEVTTKLPEIEKQVLMKEFKDDTPEPVEKKIKKIYEKIKKGNISEKAKNILKSKLFRGIGVVFVVGIL